MTVPAEHMETVHALLDLVVGDAGAPEGDTARLRELLDALALAMHGPEPEDAGRDVEAPRRDYQETRAVVCTRFPGLGLYRAPSLDPDEGELIGDAVDDLADVVIDLDEVAWIREHVGMAEARWQLAFGFRHHWGAHLRSLQWYLHEWAASR